MGWRDLLQKEETAVLPWTGGKSLHSGTRTFKLGNRLQEFGWYTFTIEGTKTTSSELTDPDPDLLKHTVRGYLVGNRLVPDGTAINPDPSEIAKHSERVFLVPDHLERFSRIQAGRVYPEGPLIFKSEEFPLGPEDQVLDAFLDHKDKVHDIPGVVPALDAAFRMEVYQREQAELRRQELARIRAEEEARLERERRRQELLENLGDGARRRALAHAGDFKEAAEAALRVGGAQYLDHRRGRRRGEWIVKYRVDGQRLECVCDTDLHIIDAGICLSDHDTGEKGDTYFTLESLPAVVREAVRDNVLVIWRHV